MLARNGQKTVKNRVLCQVLLNKCTCKPPMRLKDVSPTLATTNSPSLVSVSLKSATSRCVEVEFCTSKKMSKKKIFLFSQHFSPRKFWNLTNFFQPLRNGNFSSNTAYITWPNQFLRIVVIRLFENDEKSCSCVFQTEFSTKPTRARGDLPFDMC